MRSTWDKVKGRILFQDDQLSSIRFPGKEDGLERKLTDILGRERPGVASPP